MTGLRPPVAPAQLPPGVLVGARPATEQETPATALRMAHRAAAAGWEVAVTYAEAVHPKAAERAYVFGETRIRSVAVRMARPGRAYRVAVWWNGGFASAWHRDARGFRKLGARYLDKILAREAAIRRVATT